MDDYIAVNKEAYNALAKEYESRVHAYVERDPELLNPFINSLKAKFAEPIRVLDIGPGTGLSLMQLSKQGFHVVGIDVAEKMLEVSYQLCPKAILICDNFLNVSLFPGTFEGIMSKASIHLFPKVDALKVLEKINQLLVPNGFLYITTTTSDVSKEGYSLKRDYAADVKRYRKLWTRQELLEAIEGAGMAVYEETSDYEDRLKKRWINIYAYKL